MSDIAPLVIQREYFKATYCICSSNSNSQLPTPQDYNKPTPPSIYTMLPLYPPPPPAYFLNGTTNPSTAPPAYTFEANPLRYQQSVPRATAAPRVAARYEVGTPLGTAHDRRRKLVVGLLAVAVVVIGATLFMCWMRDLYADSSAETCEEDVKYC